MPRLLRRASGLTLLLLTLGLPAVAHADPAGPDWYKEANVNATWTQVLIPSTDGVMLHADVLRPKDLPAGTKSPVILSAGPYFNHSGEVGPAGPVEDAPFDPLNTEAGPSHRFQDFVIGAKLMQKGYTFMMVDLRGFGGSTGCLDWGGPGEQADVKASVEWAASQPWSTGKVGMYGKSYDGVTGLLGIAQQPKGLAAVIAQEPVFDLYRYLYSNSVRFENSLATPALYDAIAATPGVVPADDADYLAGSAQSLEPSCLTLNYLGQAADNDHTSSDWKPRDLIAATKGKTTPTFLTQGFLENNTKPDGAWDFYNGLAGPKRGWFGMWDHIRGNDTVDGKNDYQPWFDESMRFFDHYVAGKSLAEAPTDKDPAVEVQSQDGKWRAESAWPPADSVGYTTTLKTGSYTDDANTDGSGDGLAGLHGDEPGAEGVWTFSPPLTHDAQFSGVPRVKLDLKPTLGAPDPQGATGMTNVNVAVDVYDVAADGTATILSRTAALIPDTGKLDLGMYGNDWNIATGHRIGVLITDANAEWYEPVPSMDDVTITSASITLPFLAYTRTGTIPGKATNRLGEFLSSAPFVIPAATITAGTSPAFAVPAARTAAPVVAPTPAAGAPGAGESAAAAPTAAGRPASGAAAAALVTKAKRSSPGSALTVRIGFPAGHGARRVRVKGTAPKGARVTISLRRDGRSLLTRRVTAGADGSYSARFVVRRAGRYTASVSARGAGRTLTATSRRVTVRVFGRP